MTLCACSRAPQRRIERIAILPFENLTGEASLDWVVAAAPQILAAELAGSPTIVPFLAPAIGDAYLAAADRLVHGYFTNRGDSLRFEIEVEDAARHKMTLEDTARGGVLAAMNGAARLLDPAAHAFSTANPRAVAEWGQGDFERALADDPDFGAAWLAWTETTARKGDAAQAIGIADRALAQPGLRSPMDRARIELLRATLAKDAAGRERALTNLERLDPADTALKQTLGEAELNARNFSAAAALYRQVLEREPQNAGAMLLLGYAEAWAGDVDAAKKTFEDYGKLPGQKTNSLDSLGELYFLHGRFDEAEKYFLQADQSNPAFLGGQDLLKAAYARWLAGDLKGADAIFARYLDFRRRARDVLIAWREASWDYATGRRDLAIAKLAGAPREIAQRQIAAWRAELPEDIGELKIRFENAPPSSDGEARAFYAAALLKAGNKEEARKLVELWPLPVESGVDSALESEVYPTFLEIRRALGLPVLNSK